MDSTGTVAETRDRAIAGAVLHVEAYGRNFESFLRGPGFLEGPKRFLPNGSPMELFWEYVAVMRARSEEPAYWSHSIEYSRISGGRSSDFGRKVNMLHVISALVLSATSRPRRRCHLDTSFWSFTSTTYFYSGTIGWCIGHFVQCRCVGQSKP